MHNSYYSYCITSDLGKVSEKPRIVCVRACVLVSEREGDRERESEKDKERERVRKIKRERERERERESATSFRKLSKRQNTSDKNENMKIRSFQN